MLLKLYFYKQNIFYFIYKLNIHFKIITVMFLNSSSNISKILESLIYGGYKYLQENHLESMVLGISGGLDSTLTAYIANKIVQQHPEFKLIGISLPSYSNKDDENNSALSALSFCNEYKVVDIENTYNTIKNLCENTYDDALQNGNIKARLRMIYLYNVASKNKGVVLDTDNLTEHYLGFWTLHGDVGDLNFLNTFWKNELYTIINWIIENDKDLSETQLKALIKARDITPTDGNGVKAGGDLAQIAPGCTYEQVDTVLAEITQPRVIVRNAKLIKDTGITHDSFKLIEKRYWNSEYKRAKSPHIINPRDFYYIFKK